MIEQTMRSSFAAAASAVNDRREEINKLNVFPVPDGDTGTNMALTLSSVVRELDELPPDANMAKVAEAVRHGSLMGARGNSGVITSQILRGLAEGLAESEGPVETPQIAAAFRRAVEVAFRAVKKPVEGTILTVLRDVSRAADQCEKRKLSVSDTLDTIVAEAFDSVARTPDLLPVLKENGVVDSGAFGFSIFLEAFCDAAMGRTVSSRAADQALARATAKVDIELNDDWEGSDYRYCTEFLFNAEHPLDEDAARDFLGTMGDCELLVGSYPDYKVHVHTDHPDQVLAHMLEHGQIYEVYIHNMDMEAHERTAKIAQDRAAAAAQIAQSEPPKPLIVMAAQSACAAADFPMAVVLTRSVPQGFSAMFSFDPSATLDENVEAMTEALDAVHDGEVTRAVRDSQTADGRPIHTGDVIGIVDDEILFVGSSVHDVTLAMVASMEERFGGDTLTFLGGADLTDEEYDQLVSELEEQHGDLEVDAHKGGQPLYPVVLSIE